MPGDAPSQLAPGHLQVVFVLLCRARHLRHLLLLRARKGRSHSLVESRHQHSTPGDALGQLGLVQP